jgi:hypothetical protein
VRGTRRKFLIESLVRWAVSTHLLSPGELAVMSRLLHWAAIGLSGHQIICLFHKCLGKWWAEVGQKDRHGASVHVELEPCIDSRTAARMGVDFVAGTRDAFATKAIMEHGLEVLPREELARF